MSPDGGGACMDFGFAVSIAKPIGPYHLLEAVSKSENGISCAIPEFDEITTDGNVCNQLETLQGEIEAAML